MKYTLECSREEDGRWRAEVPQLYGVVAYDDSEIGALTKAQALALRMLAEQLETGSSPPCEISMSIVHVNNNVDDADIVPSPPADQAAYDAWSIAGVQEALDDGSPTMSTEEVMRWVQRDTGPERAPPADPAAYDAWLAEEVREALEDDSPSIPHDEAMRIVRAAVFGK